METNDLNFISVTGRISGYERAKLNYPNSIIFYQSASKWIIYARGLEFEFGNSPDFKSAYAEITANKLSIELIQLTCIKYTDIDQSITNGAGLVVNNNSVRVNLELATRESSGALSKEDKRKIDSFDWIIL